MPTDIEYPMSSATWNIEYAYNTNVEEMRISISITAAPVCLSFGFLINSIVAEANGHGASRRPSGVLGSAEAHLGVIIFSHNRMDKSHRRQRRTGR